MINDIYLYLILTGLTIGLVMLALWRMARRLHSTNLALIRLNEQLNFDALSFLAESWPLLSKSGIDGMAWQMNWFGTPIEWGAGVRTGPPLQRTLQLAEIRLDISLYLQQARGERRYFVELLVETFLMLLHTDLWIKAGSIDAALAQMSRLNLFLQHDMKNVAQFIQLMADQLASTPADKEKKLLDYLRTSAPVIRNRADRIVQALMTRQPHDRSLKTYRLREELERLGQLHRLQCDIQGDAIVEAQEYVLDSVFDNILKNYADLAQHDRNGPSVVAIRIEGNGGLAKVTLESSHPIPTPQIERLFEPFWGKDPAGLGIGLYQAKNLMEQSRGSLTAHKTETGGLQFQVVCPLRAEEDDTLADMSKK